MATIKDVAREAGVSVATVSRVFNKRGYLSTDVKKKVALAMKKLDYQPNDIARSLHNQKSHIIGLIIPSAKNPYFAEITHYVEGYAYAHGYKVMLCNSLQDKNKEHEYIDMLKRSQVDGIIMGSHTAETGDYENLNLPLVSLDRQLGAGIPYVCCDNYHGGEIAVQYLLKHGCKKLMHLCTGIQIDIIANKRTQAFFDVCKKNNIPHFHVELPETSVVEFTEAEHTIIRNALIVHPEVDGVFASNDIMALAVSDIAKTLNHKLKVIGFDGCTIQGLPFSRLPTIRQPVDAISRYAVENLIHKISGEQVPVQTMLAVELVEPQQF